MTGATERLRVELAERSYEIAVGPGLIAGAGPEILPLMRRRQAVVVTDENVAAQYLAPLRASLKAAGIAHHAVVLPPGEETKSLDHFGRLAEEILGFGVERGTMLVALGGGVVGDLTGFAAATLLRGIDFVQLPTTLLAQVDSSVGGKTAINMRAGKNLIGAFYQPRLVLADTASLASLPRRELLAGYAETVKYGLIKDAEFFAWCERQGNALLALEEEPLRGRDHDQLPDEGRRRRGRRARGGRPGAAQFRPHLRSCARNRNRVRQPAVAWRGGGARHGAGLRLRRALSVLPRRPRPIACAGILPPPGCRRHSPPSACRGFQPNG